jgi:CelD/BcsL family acetyltransferase involved in cellulose biosynthesis
MDDLDVVMAPATEPSTSQAAEILEGGKPVKRTASTAELDTVDLIPPNPDHNDYISKAKRPRVASSVSSMASVDNYSEDEVNLNGKPRTKDEKYMERRRKNNIASRRSRETRKQKFTQMEEQAIELEKSNELLRQKVEELERLTKHMKETLVERLARRN